MSTSLLMQSVEWIRSVALARLRGSPGLNQLDTSEHSPIWRIINAVAWEARKIVVDFVSLSVNIIPTESIGLWLRRHAAAYGITALEASEWEGTITLEADGAATPAFAAGLELIFSGDSTRYQTTEAVIAGDWAGGFTTVGAESITTGTVANKDTGTALTVVAPPAGLLATATLASTVKSATDAETDSLLQTRLRNRLSGMPGAGNCAEYRQWVLEAIASNYGGHSNEAEDCAVYPRWDDGGGTLGTVTVALFGPQEVVPVLNRVVSADCIADIQEYIDARKPIGSTVTVESIVGVTLGAGMEVEVRPRQGYEPDWYGPLIPIAVVSTVAGSMRVNLDADPRPYISIGDRVVFYCNILAPVTEQEFVREVGADYVILREWPEGGDPAAGSDIMEGGPLWQPVMNAIREVFDGLGPATSSTAGKERWPVEEYERPSTIFLSDLYHAVDSVEGVASSDWSAPAADQARTEPAADPITMWVIDPNLLITWPAP